jgi:hypothetical protein
MPTCDMGFEHEAAHEPEPVVVETDPGPNENDVKIAEIEAAAGIEREKLWTEQEKARMDGELEELRGELRGMREVLDRIAPEPEPEPEPVIIPAPEPAAEPEPEVTAPPEEKPAPKAAEKKRGFF